MKNPLVSIIVNNYNYEQFLKEAIDSALHQTYPYIEVIVVDDGSTDRSNEIIASYGNQIIPISKTNGGQASAFNSGFLKSRGEIILFLDADDILFPFAVKSFVTFFEEKNIAKVHWPLCVINEKGSKTGHLNPKAILPEGD